MRYWPHGDHPRSRGVYKATTVEGAASDGSSPLARGLPCPVGTTAPFHRIIPARAGFTPTGTAGSPRSRDHPRSRGVYKVVEDANHWAKGSSPLARGLQAIAENGQNLDRIIPARAGFTRSCPENPSAAWDHPRSRGVYPSPSKRPEPTRGSSPLARGLQGRDKPQGGPLGIIPARAGFTHPDPPCHPWAPDHPRSRGVYPQQRPRSPSPWGSSPLARGLPKEGSDQAAPSRIIPARAGFTRHRVRVLLQRPDHPRSRGVYPAMTPSLEGGPGSSPLARGLRCSLTGKRFTEGIIPARAGFTSKGDQESSGRRDHPRSRGVYLTE